MLSVVARKLRLQFEGAIYHVMNRGDHQEPIVRGVADRELFVKTLGEACEKTDWQVHAWCLMSNHFHLVVETPKANLVAGMKWLLGTYTSRFNRRHKLFGHLFSGRYKALFVDGSGSGYLKSACDYVHLNPVRAKLLSRSQRLRDFRWSSFAEYLKSPLARPGWLRTDHLLGEHGIQKDSPAGRAEFEKRLELRRASEELERLEELVGGWCLGSEEFRHELLEQMNERKGAEHYGAEIRESATDKAERLVKEELHRLGWRELDLEAYRKGAPEKLKIASRLRKETTMSLAWIAQRLHMGTKTHLSHLLYWQNRNGTS
jgi:REP element-mobilizing transposase RayT